MAMNRLAQRLLLASFFTYLLFFSTVCYGSEQISVRYAEGFSVEYVGDFTAVTVSNPWAGAQIDFKYLLKPKAAAADIPVPPGYEAYQLVEVPVERLVILSTTLLAFLEKLDLMDRLVGFSDLSRIYSSAISEKINKNGTVNVGQGPNLQVETILDLEPEMIFTFATGSFRDAHPKLLEAGLKVGVVGEYMESHPLGRSEWLKFLALFCGRGGEAEKVFAELEKRYIKLAAMTAGLERRPTVITGVPFSGRWYIAGGRSFVGRFLQDAGADYGWKETTHTGSLPVDIELVFERGLDADFWLNTGSWTSLAQAEKSDPRFIRFTALKSGRLYNNNKRVSEHGNNDYWESGMMAPDIVLADLIHIFHPDKLPGHRLVYYTHLQ